MTPTPEQIARTVEILRNRLEMRLVSGCAEEVRTLIDTYDSLRARVQELERAAKDYIIASASADLAENPDWQYVAKLKTELISLLNGGRPQDHSAEVQAVFDEMWKFGIFSNAFTKHIAAERTNKILQAAGVEWRVK